MLSLYFCSHVCYLLVGMLNQFLFCSDQLSILVLLYHRNIVVHVLNQSTLVPLEFSIATQPERLGLRRQLAFDIQCPIYYRVIGDELRGLVISLQLQHKVVHVWVLFLL